ncbi:MAG: pyrimidine 5'-nucleotidase [Hyphomicrobiales bacterium]|nr:pyrimidine 5'-nucleotidase [Hyphomicrobiales bacterium]
MNELPRTRPVTGHDAETLRVFRRVDTWIFDLDNTLYPRSTNLFLQVDTRIRDYVQRLLKLGPAEAHEIQKDYYRRYGTTLRGLMDEHGVAPDDFLEFVHNIDHSVVAPDPVLADAIDRLAGRKFIFTNGSRAHAEKVAERLGVTNHFEDIFDIVDSKLMPKPNPQTYDRFIAATGINPSSAAMFEDLSRNLEAPSALGMITALVVPAGIGEVFHEDWEVEGRDAAHVRFLTDDLGSFLNKVLAAIAA